MRCIRNGTAFVQKRLSAFGSVHPIEQGKRVIVIQCIEWTLVSFIHFDSEVEHALKLGDGPFHMYASGFIVGAPNDAQRIPGLVPLFLLRGVSGKLPGQCTQNTTMHEVAKATAGGQVLELDAVGRKYGGSCIESIVL